MLVPRKGILGIGCGVACATVVDGQIQCHHRVTTAQARKRVRQTVRAGGDARMFIPVEAVTRSGRCIPRLALVNRQMQGYHAVAATRARKRVRQTVRAGGDARMLVPVETVTRSGGRVTRLAVVDGQVQSFDRIISRDVGEGMSVIAGLRDTRMLIPVERVTRHSCCVTQRGMSDCQVQGHH